MGGKKIGGRIGKTVLYLDIACHNRQLVTGWLGVRRVLIVIDRGASESINILPWHVCSMRLIDPAGAGLSRER